MTSSSTSATDPRWTLTLNVTDASSHTPAPHCGSIGHVLSFSESVRLAARYGFHAVNADRAYLRKHGAEKVAEMLEMHDLKPAAFAFSAAFNSDFSRREFEKSLDGFERDLLLCSRAGFKRCVGFVQPSSTTIRFHDHFNLLTQRLRRVVPMLDSCGVRLGLEFIGPATARIDARYDFIHTLDGIRCLIAAADARQQVGIKFDAMHWHTSGAGVADIEKLAPEEVVYVELNDGLKGDYTRFSLPEFQRELPGETGIIDLSGMLTALGRVGFKGPVVVEPWNLPLRRMTPEEAVKKVKEALVQCLEGADVKRRKYLNPGDHIV